MAIVRLEQETKVLQDKVDTLQKIVNADFREIERLKAELGRLEQLDHLPNSTTDGLFANSLREIQ
jgi:hypothetical protein